MTSKTKLGPLLSACVAVVVAASCTGGSAPSPSARGPHFFPPKAISGDSPFAHCQRLPTAVPDTEVEPSVAVDPRDSRHLVAAWQQDRNSRGASEGIVAARSNDRGASWRTSLPPLTRCEGGSYMLASDPVVTVGPDRTYLSAIGVLPGGKEEDVIASTSTDGGETWSAPIVVRRDQGDLGSPDKEWILADPRVRGTAFLVWVEYRKPGPGEVRDVNAAFFSRTDDGGATWTTPVRVYGANTETQFHTLAELADGTLLDAFVEAQSLSGHPPPPLSARVAVARSTDGGRTWAEPVTAARFQFTVVADPTGTDSVRAAGEIIGFAAGPGARSYIAYTEEHPGGRSTLAILRSDDGGLSWSPPLTVVDGPNEVFLPALSVDQTGMVGVLWYAFRPTRARGPLSTDVWFAWSEDQGRTWRRARLAGPFDLHTAKLTTQGDFVGDYQGVASPDRGRFVAVFVQAQPASTHGKTDVFVSRIDVDGT